MYVYVHVGVTRSVCGYVFVMCLCVFRCIVSVLGFCVMLYVSVVWCCPVSVYVSVYVSVFGYV